MQTTVMGDAVEPYNITKGTVRKYIKRPAWLTYSIMEHDHFLAAT